MHAYLGIVTHSGQIEPETGASLERAIPALESAGIKVSIARWSCDSLIADARNAVAAQFFRSGATDLVFIDSDVAWDGDELTRLLSYPVELVAGVYRKKKRDIEWPVQWLPDPLHADPATGLLAVKAAPAGFLRITREAMAVMTVFYADRKYTNPVAGEAWCLFDCGLSEGLYWGEDYLFCQRWRDTGGKVWIDPRMTLHHVGWKDASNPQLGKTKFTGCIGEWLLDRPKEEFEAA